jgi:V8-like Glu-specific endopeptidase
MHRNIRPLATVSIATVMAVTSSLALGSLAGASASGANPRQPIAAPSLFSTSSAKAVESYWTPARMAAAKPMTNFREDRNQPRVKVSDEVGKNTQSIAGIGAPDDQAGRVLQAAENQPSAVYPFPFGRRFVEPQLRRVAPYRAVGRIFFRQGGVRYSCSGASVVGGPRQVVFTAGHCLNDGLGATSTHWSTDVIFVPGRKGGKSKNPYGQFVALNLWVPQGWSFDGLDEYDMGAFNVGKNAKRQTLKKAVGALGFAYNQSRIQHWDIFGYPAQAPFKGNALTTCATQHAVDDGAGGGFDPIGVGCDMTGGSSGGPWIIRLRRGNMLNGITTYGYQAQPGALYGPYFEGTANKIRCAAATGNADANDC